jgi:hypothetical protein
MQAERVQRNCAPSGPQQVSSAGSPLPSETVTAAARRIVDRFMKSCADKLGTVPIFAQGK